MRTVDFSLKVKGLQDTGLFTGLASSYAGIDLAGDTVQPGAFSQSIKSQGPYGFPLLWNHDTGAPIGIARVADSSAGLVVAGELTMADPVAQKAYVHLKANSVRGLSIGFWDIKSEPQATGGRLLKELKLFEVSICAIPCDPKAVVSSVKSVAGVLEALRSGSLPAADVAALKRLLAKDSLCQCSCSECVGGDCEACSNEDCIDPNCDNPAATLSALKQLARELRAI